MAAVATKLPPPRCSPRLVPPRPTPKSVPSVPPPLPPSKTDVDAEEVMEVSDTAIHEIVVEEAQRQRQAPPQAAPMTGVHPGRVLLRTIAFFVAHVATDAMRFFRAHWVRAAARARS